MTGNFRITLGVLVVSCAGLVLCNVPQNIAGIIATYQSEPEGFNPADYPRIVDAAGNDQVQIVATRHFGDKWTSSFYLPQQQLFGLSFYSEEMPSAIVFFDSGGEQVGLYQVPDAHSIYELRNNEILTYSGYHVVRSEGISRLKPYQVVASEPVGREQVEALQRKSTQTHVIEHSLAPKDSAEAQQKLDVLLFKVGATWQKAVIDSENFVAQKYEVQEVPVQQHELEIKNARKQPNGQTMSPLFNIVRDWFDREEFQAKTSASLGSSTGIGRAAFWRGVGYYTATVGGQSFRFSLPGDKQYKDNRTAARYSWLPGTRFLLLKPSPESHSFPYLVRAKSSVP